MYELADAATLKCQPTTRSKGKKRIGAVFFEGWFIEIKLDARNCAPEQQSYRSRVPTLFQLPDIPTRLVYEETRKMEPVSLPVHNRSALDLGAQR